MNQQIEKLLGQAYDEAVPETWTTLSSEQLGRIYEKFAELIVRECAGIAREIGNNTEPDDFALDRCYEIEDQIKQHFGVEE